MSAAKKNVIRFEREFRDFLRPLFNHPLIDNGINVMILLSLVAAVGSAVFDIVWLNRLHVFFTFLFATELSLRFFTYDRKHKREYLRDWWIDWVATIPWDFILILFFPGGSPAAARLLRLPRIIRLLRFRKAQDSRIYRTLAYRFKRLLEGSIFRQMLVLAAGSFAIVSCFALILNHIGAEFDSGDNFWFALISVVSSDSLFELQEQSGLVKGLIFLLTFIGIVVFNGILIAIIVGKLMGHLNEIKKGYGEVCESGHIVLLGESEYIPHILDELQKYCQMERKRLMKVVIMKEMADEIDDPCLFDLRPRIEVIQRVGSSYNPKALERISLHKSRGAVVFGGYGKQCFDVDLNDAMVNKAFLSMNCLVKGKKSAAHNLALRPVLTYLSGRNYSRKCLFESGVIDDALSPVQFDPMFFTANLMTCMCENPYAYQIYSELFTSEGSEFHILRSASFPNQIMSFGQMLVSFPKAIPIGFRREGETEFHLVPGYHEEIPAGADVLVLARNSSDAAKVSRRTPIDRSAAGDLSPSVDKKRTVVVVGVNDKLPTMLKELQTLNREVHVIDNQSEAEFREWLGKRIQVRDQQEFTECHFSNEAEVLKTLHGPLEKAAQVIILADGHLINDATPDQIDADTLSRMLMIQKQFPEAPLPDLIVEILTPDSEAVFKNIFGNCFEVIGPLFIGRMLTTFTLYPDLEPVFSSMIKPGKVDIVIREIVPDGQSGKEFADLLVNPPNNAIPLGVIVHGRVFLNPDKKKKLSAASEVVYLAKRHP